MPETACFPLGCARCLTASVAAITNGSILLKEEFMEHYENCHSAVPQTPRISFTINLLFNRRFFYMIFIQQLRLTVSYGWLQSLIINSIKILFIKTLTLVFCMCCLPQGGPATSQWDSDLTRGFVTVTRTCLVASLTGIC